MWSSLLFFTRTVATSISAMLPQIELIVDLWSDAPPEAAEQKIEAMKLLAGLQNSLSGSIDRSDIRDLEA